MRLLSVNFVLVLLLFIPGTAFSSAINKTDAAVLSYDQNNIFARIIRRESPATIVYEDDTVLAFEDIAPKAPVHVLVIPKGPYRSLTAMASQGKDEEIAALFRALGVVATIKGVAGTGYRVVANTGPDGGQEVPHLHFHVLGGHRIGPMVTPRDLEL